MNLNDHKIMVDDLSAHESENNHSEQPTTESFKQCADELFKLTAEYANYKRSIEADFANYKRRVEKERLEWTVASQSSVLSAILPFVDDFDRALQSSEQAKALQNNPEFKVWISGFRLLAKNLHKSLELLGVALVDCTGDFNPELHEAMVQVESLDHQSGQIVQVLSQGYSFKGQIIRHARVSVAK